MIVPPLSPTLTEPNNQGSDLLDELDAFFARFVAFPTVEARWAVVLWAVHTHLLNAFDSTPRLAVLSPEKGSGKTRTLEVLELVVTNALRAVNISAAALYRVIEDQAPTLLLDEADTYLGPTVAKNHEDLRGIINAGHRRGALVYRGEVAGKTVKVVAFPAFAPAAIAGIGDLPDTVIDRSVVITMKRRAQHETVEEFRERRARPEGERLRERLEVWANEIGGTLGDQWPTMPPGITDRAADVWEPLLMVADAACGHWPARARQAAVTINDARQSRDPSLGILLLTDCRRIFAERNVDRLTTEDMIAALVALDEGPWGDLRGQPIDARGIARRLKKYEVGPGDHRFGESTKKGYSIDAFHDAWSRYLPPVALVAHVAPAEGETGAGTDVASPEAGLGGYLHNNTHEEHASSLWDGQQGQQPWSEPVEGEEGLW